MAGLVLDGLELQDEAAGIWFDVVAGDLDTIAEYEGEDDKVVDAAGREPGEWIADIRPLKLFGHVWGVGLTRAARQAAYRAKVDALIAKIHTPTLVDLVAHPPNLGIASGETATLSDLRPLGITPGPPRGWEGARSFDVMLESIASPPEWVIAP
jgi:hypothetical protein